MLKTVEKRIVEFAKDTGLTERREIVHGTLYVKLHEDKECDHFHKVIRTFYIDNINPEGGVNMYSVGDEFAFDFVPEDAKQTGTYSEFAEEDLLKNQGEPIASQVDTLLQLENEMEIGK